MNLIVLFRSLFKKRKWKRKKEPIDEPKLSTLERIHILKEGGTVSEDSTIHTGSVLDRIHGIKNEERNEPAFEFITLNKQNTNRTGE
ncbi:hypothetical protein H9649_12040 [Sporosarcina sp. Sa2YVA2]|uniref:Uncharacterized protein n=1 Tax=Sporosarcina quadrami TaxID=2762234 RepID=A0ABR8UBZ1_9BACL|nr:hypothetical protein [Sporosarcina quadrami]MBD7985320.1 hypothetical protein [Sporosarcina quadrami]